MYHPNTFTLNLEQMLSGSPIDTACGVLAITVQSARGIKATKLGGGAPDPYVSISVSGRAELARTSTKRSTSVPSMNVESIAISNAFVAQSHTSMERDTLHFAQQSERHVVSFRHGLERASSGLRAWHRQF